MEEQLELEKDLMKNMDYLNLLVEEVNKRGISDMDSNLLYEVAYASTYLNSVLDSNDSNNEIYENIRDIKSLLDNVLSNAYKCDISKEKRISSYKGLLRSRYKKLSDACCYRINRRVSLINYLSDESGMALITLVAVLLAQFYPSDLFYNDRWLFNIIKIVALLMFLPDFVYLAFDIAYLVSPYIRKRFKNLYTDTVIEILNRPYEELTECLKDSNDYGKKTRCYNRVDRNKDWLNDMLSTLKEDSSITHDGSILLKSLMKLQGTLIDLESKDFLNKDYFLELVKVESLRDKYLELYKR